MIRRTVEIKIVTLCRAITGLRRGKQALKMLSLYKKIQYKGSAACRDRCIL
jgi:hypothetical protein